MSTYQIKTTAHPIFPEPHPEFPAPAKGVPFYSPEQNPPAGTAIKTSDDEVIPKLFTPLKIRGVTMTNRIWVSPMCQYSAVDGFQTPWHVTHYGGMAQRGPGLIMLEATAVQARGRISPQDSGLWLDAHTAGLRQHVEFAHSQNTLIAVQIGHAGRKASTVAPWLSAGPVATEAARGWPSDIIGPTDEAFDNGYPTPRAATLAEIEEVKKDFVLAVKRAIDTGFDVIELHFAHGFLVSTFLSPAVNKRTDQYGGSFENRVRLALEILDEVRAIMPDTMPLFVRISATDWLDTNPEYSGESWTIDQSIKLAQLFAERGVDVLDVSSGGNHAQQKIKVSPGYQAALAKQIKKVLGDKMLISTVGNVTTGTLAQELLEGGKSEDDTPLDLVAAGRMFQKNPGLVWYWADDLNVDITVAHQIGWGFAGRGQKKKQK